MAEETIAIVFVLLVLPVALFKLLFGVAPTAIGEAPVRAEPVVSDDIVPAPCAPAGTERTPAEVRSGEPRQATG